MLRREGGGLKLETMSWGFPGPAAAKGRPVTNIRNLDSPFWRSALDNVERRCIVPVTRFCEWTAEPDPATKRKRKVWFGLMHEERTSPCSLSPASGGRAEGGPFMAFLTCEPNAMVGAVHPKAMPVMLRPADALAWLDSEREQRLRPCGAVRGRRHADHRDRLSAANREQIMAKTATAKTGQDEEKEERPRAARGRARSRPRPRRTARAARRRRRRKRSVDGFEGLAKLVEHPLVADLLAAGAIAAVAAIAEHQAHGQGRRLVEDGQGGRQGRRGGDGQEV